jgi:hypothetical protein
MVNSLNLQEIDQEQALDLSKFFMHSKGNCFFFGRRGIGKTRIPMQAAGECGYNIIYINLSVIERPDLAGYPNLHDSNNDIVTFKSPYFLPRLKNGDKPNNILLFDEVDKAPPEITAPLLEILQFRSINGTPINVASCILTGNLLNEGANSNLINTALLDRGAKYILTFNFEKWVDWAKVNGVHDLILGFLRANTEFACGKIDDVCYASPSPRGWTLASEALIHARDSKIIDVDSITQIISGFVGSEAGLRFKIWYQHYRKYEPFIHSIIESRMMNLDFKELMPTEKLVFVVAACYYAKQKCLSSKGDSGFVYLENLCHFLSSYGVDHEVQMMGLYNSFDFGLVTKHKLYTCKEFFNLFTRISENIGIKK